MILTGPSGCGKRSLITAYCNDHNLKLIEYREPKLADEEQPPENAGKPVDLMCLISFLKKITQGASNSVKVMGSSFTGQKSMALPTKQSQSNLYFI